MKKKATIVDIAAQLGITPSAVSKALSGNTRISKATRLAVENMANKLKYSPNNMASGLRKGKSGLIAILVPGIQYSFFASAIKGAEEVLSRDGYNVIIAQSQDNADLEEKQLDAFLRANVEGVIASLAIETKEIKPFKAMSANIPLVLFDRVFEDDQVSSVVIDDFAGAVKAVDHLAEMGYKRIAHLAGYSHVLPFRRRIQGFKHALLKNKLTFYNEYLLHCAPNSPEGYAGAEKLFTLKNPPDAIFAASDYLAFGAMRAVQDLGFTVPDDIGIVGFSNEEFSGQVTPKLTSIDQFSESLGATAAQIMIEQIRNQNAGVPIAVHRHVLAPNLIIRESSTPPLTVSKRRKKK